MNRVVFLIDGFNLYHSIVEASKDLNEASTKWITDISPTVSTALNLFPTKNIILGFPYKRKNKELASLTGKFFKISKEQILRHQFPPI
jgi:hypothetical protein